MINFPFKLRAIINNLQIKEKEKHMKNSVSKNVKHEGIESMQKKAFRFWCKYSAQITLALLVVIMMHGTVFAAGADSLWNTLAAQIEKWVTRLGGVVMFIGGIMFGLGWKSDDAERKSQGVNTIIAGGIVIAVAQLTGTFFA